MTISIRTKLTVLYVFVLAASLIAFSLIFSYSLSRIFTKRIDTQITSIADMMAHMVIKPSGQLFLPRDFEIVLERFFGIRTGENYIQVLEPGGEIAARSSNLGTLNLPLSKEAHEAALSGKTTFEIIRNIGRYPVRVVTKPIMFKNIGMVAIVQVGFSLEGIDEIFHSLFYIFGMGVVTSVIIASVFGYLIAARALKPVKEITAMAKSIGAENLNQRITVDAAQDEIGELASTINEMIGRLEKSFRQIKQFTADASHELKTPLTVLKGEMEVALRAREDRARLRETIESSLEEIDRMNYIVRNLLDLARMDAEKGAVPKELVKIDEVVRERCEQLMRQALDRGISLSIIKIMPAVVYGDHVRMGQLISNLIDNAVKYSKSGDRVEVSIEALEKNAVITVRDTGIGISEDDIAHIFDRFYRADKARSSDGDIAGGAGLGLSICKEIVESCDGTIDVKSAHGSGAVFTVRLPLAS